MQSNHVKPFVDLRRTAGALAILAAVFCVGWCEVRLVWWGIDLAAAAMRVEKGGAYVSVER